MHDTKAQVTQAIQQALADAFPPSSGNSGSHKILVVGQIVVNLPAEPANRPCCGNCHK